MEGALRECRLNLPPGNSYADLKAFVEDRPGHDRRYAIDASKIQRELGWAAAHDFPQAMQLTVDWYLENEDWVKSVMS